MLLGKRRGKGDGTRSAQRRRRQRIERRARLGDRDDGGGDIDREAQRADRRHADVHGGAPAIGVHAAAAGRGHLDDVRHVLRQLDGRGREGFAGVAQHRVGGGDGQQFGRDVRGAEQRDDDVDVGQRIEHAGRIGDVLHGGAAALAGVEIIQERQAAGVVEAQPSIAESECVGAVSVVELVVRSDVLQSPFDDFAGDVDPIPLDPAAEAVEHLDCERVLQRDADLVEQGVGGLFDAIQLRVGQEAGCVDGRSTLTPSLKRGRIPTRAGR